MSAALALIVIALVLFTCSSGAARRRWKRNARRAVRRRQRAVAARTPVLSQAMQLKRQAKLARRRRHPTWLYRLPAALPNPRDTDGRYRQSSGKVGEHLYVGVAELGRLRKRWREHRGLVGGRRDPRKVWAWRVCWWLPMPVLPGLRWWGVFPSVRLYWTRTAAEAAELRAIAEELPTYNIAGARPRRQPTRSRSSAA